MSTFPTLFLVAGLALTTFSPAVAQEDGTPDRLDPVIDSFASPGQVRLVARFTTHPTDSSKLQDPAGDFEHSTGDDPGYTPAHIDIIEAQAMQFAAGPIYDRLFGPTDTSEFWASTGPSQVDPPSHDPFHTFTGQQPQDGSQYGGGALLFGLSLAGTPEPPVPGRCEYVVWVHDLSRGPTFVNHPTFPGDPAGGTNVAFGLRVEPEGQGPSSTFSLEYQKGSGFSENPATDIRAFITPGYVGLLVPASQIGEMAGINFHSFCMQEGFTFDPALTGADQTGLVQLTTAGLGNVVIEEQAVVMSTTTTVGTTTTILAGDQPGVAVVEPEPVSEPGSFPWWLLLAGGASGVALGEWLLLSARRRPCRESLANWKAAQRACDDARQATEAAIRDLENADLDLENLERERGELCKAWPPACWKTEEGEWIEDSDGNRITSRDVHMRKMALSAIWEDYKAGMLTAGEVEARWRTVDTPAFREDMRASDEGFKDLLRQIDQDIVTAKNEIDESFERAQQQHEKTEDARAGLVVARNSYEDCIAAQAETTAASHDPCGGSDGSRRVRSTGPAQDRIRVNLDFSVMSKVTDGSRSENAEELMVVYLDEAAASLDQLGALLSARSAALHLGGASRGFPEAKYLVTADGIVRGGIDAGTAGGAVPEAPTTPVSAAHEVAEQTASLGELVRGKVGAWTAGGEVIEVRSTLFYQEVSATPALIEECRTDQGWVCVEEVWEIDVSKLLSHESRPRVWAVGTSQLKDRYQGEIQRLSESASNIIMDDASALVRWRAKHEARACDR